MKKALFYSLVVLFWSCDNGKQTQNTTPGTTEVLETPKAVPIEKIEETLVADTTPEADHLSLKIDSFTKVQIEEVGETFSKVPYLFFYQDEPYFVVYNGDWNKDPSKRFEQNGHYGIVNYVNTLTLEVEYDKIYNPDVTFSASIEVKKDGKVGLFHFDDNELLEPQFDFIVPQHSPGQMAYGSKNGDWYSIAYNEKFHIKRTSFSFTKYLKDFPLKTEDFHKTQLHNVLHKIHDEVLWEGGGVVVIPSYLEQFRAFAPVFENFILPYERAEGGLGEISLVATNEKELPNQISSFLIDIYEEYFYVRGEAQKVKSLATFNQENHSFSYTKLNQKNKEYFCQEENIRFINDSLLEVQATQSPGHLYNWESQFSYYRITASGQIQALESHRHFDQSQFARLEDRHFRGCFGKPMNEEERLLLKDEDSDLHIWRSQHLSVEDLDIMRNEIFATYGYRFTSEKWQNYFNQFDWYQPAYDNVDDQLTELDKANIKTILALKATMTPHEEQFTKKEATGYSAPG